ncbi:MAG: hypothetical protein Q8Q20_05835 [bacterium]|nr:hypothetical protein [bacterium]
MSTSHKFFDGLPQGHIDANNRFFEALRPIHIVGPEDVIFEDWMPRMDWPPRVRLHVIRTLLAYAWETAVANPEEWDYGTVRPDEVDSAEAATAQFLTALRGLHTHPDLSGEESADVHTICDRIAERPLSQRWRKVSDVARLLVEWAIEAPEHGFHTLYMEGTLGYRLGILGWPGYESYT